VLGGVLLAVLGAAQQQKGRAGVVGELWAAWRGTGRYAGSVEELTPVSRDPLALVPLTLASAATLVRPRSWSWFAAGSVGNYALSPDGWERIVAATSGQRRDHDG